MSRWRRAAAWIILALSFAARPVVAQSIALFISNQNADSIPPAPNFTISATQARPELGPFAVTLEMSTEAAFARPFFIGGTDGEFGVFRLDSLLPEKTRIYMRARLIDALGNVLAETQRQHVVQAWIRLIEPKQQPLVNIPTRQPTFIWNSPIISLPPGPWTYELTIINTRTGQAVALAQTTDTTFTPDSLEANTSYRWQVRARALNSRGVGEAEARSTGTFVITSPGNPTATIFYQNFPNPFGRGERVQTTCFWFDLGEPATVRLTIYTLRLQRVRQIVPGALANNRLPAGAYGRGDATAQSGCDDRFTWDGRDDNGRFVPTGIYIAEFVANGARTTKKVYWKKP